MELFADFAAAMVLEMSLCPRFKPGHVFVSGCIWKG
jgi:hypothetical protein